MSNNKSKVITYVLMGVFILAIVAVILGTYGITGNVALFGSSTGNGPTLNAPTNLVTPALEQKNKANCTDSDGGKNALVWGSATDQQKAIIDVCADSESVIEAYCNGSNATSVKIPCTERYICSHGACVIKGTNETHSACIGYTCQLVSGSGEDQCKINDDCVNQTNKVIYQGVLDMLNKCSIVTNRNQSNASSSSCNGACSVQGRTCVAAYSFDETSNLVLPYECSWGTLTTTLICNCCSVPEAKMYELPPGYEDCYTKCMERHGGSVSWASICHAGCFSDSKYSQ